ncbi:NADH dehydrogenase [ubiquinone] 1 alpha subcomplex subunit 1 [Orchesella cincta]|uniref:NADH dehydrogenase [ubiquinone] 1 alpha subcomplex subunit 1 n=1 Tax=Orchesella cincta TaxID=48709 RepID=A0A1D2MU72_ORCCI|nr:NADH dehydrogenase [ubiquinone] 1 alpha subcomplex subunit 1 [Orchesella cincta]
MWFEILPSIGVIFGALCLGQAATAFVPNMILGRPGMKRLFHPYEFDNYLRDQQLTGSPYKLQGLEAIPDEVEADKK